MIMRANSGSSFLDLIAISRDALIAVPRISGISQGGNRITFQSEDATSQG